MGQEAEDWVTRNKERLARITESCVNSVRHAPENERREQLGACILDKVIQSATTTAERDSLLQLLAERNAEAMT